MGRCSNVSGPSVSLPTKKSILRAGRANVALFEEAEIRHNEFQTGTETEVSANG